MTKNWNTFNFVFMKLRLSAIFISLFLSFNFPGLIFAEELLSEDFLQIEKDKTEICIRTDVSKASVFINNQLQGKTELLIKNLREGTYALRLVKSGVSSPVYQIHVEKGLRKTFFVEMKALSQQKAENSSGEEAFNFQPSGN